MKHLNTTFIDFCFGDMLEYTVLVTIDSEYMELMELKDIRTLAGTIMTSLN